MVHQASSYSVPPTSGRVKTCECCVRAKVRCLRTSDSPFCQRCVRLNKACYFRPARSRYNPAKREARIEALEDKVNQLIGKFNDGPQPAQESPKSSTVTVDASKVSKCTQGNSLTAQDVVNKGIISLNDAKSLLDVFRKTMMPHFPYVMLSPSVIVQELRDDKPTLFLAIMMVASYENFILQKSLEEEFKAAVWARMFLEDRSLSVELLQGLLVSLAWSQHYGTARRFTSYLHLALGIVVELWLDRPAEMRSCYPVIDVGSLCEESMENSNVRDEQRAVIGCFMISSCVSTILQRKCTFPWSPSIEKFAVDLAENPEFPSDQDLVHLVRLQHIFERIDGTLTSDASDTQVQQSDMEKHVSTCWDEIEEYKSRLPLAAPKTSLLSHLFQNLDLYLCQISLFDKNTTTSRPSTISTSPFRINALCHGLSAAKYYFDYDRTFLESTNLTESTNLIESTNLTISYTTWLQKGIMLAISCKLAIAASDKSLQHHDHINALRDDLNMPEVLKACQRRMRLITRGHEHGNPDQNASFFYAKWLRRTQEWFERQSMRSEGADAQFVPVSVLGSNPSFGDEGDSPPWPDLFQNMTADEMLNGWMEMTAMPF